MLTLKSVFIVERQYANPNAICAHGRCSVVAVTNVQLMSEKVDAALHPRFVARRGCREGTTGTWPPLAQSRRIEKGSPGKHTFHPGMSKGSPAFAPYPPTHQPSTTGAPCALAEQAIPSASPPDFRSAGDRSNLLGSRYAHSPNPPPFILPRHNVCKDSGQ